MLVVILRSIIYCAISGLLARCWCKCYLDRLQGRHVIPCLLVYTDQTIFIQGVVLQQQNLRQTRSMALQKRNNCALAMLYTVDAMLAVTTGRGHYAPAC